MSRELTIRDEAGAVSVVNPSSGAVVPLDSAATDEIAAAVDGLEGLASMVREAREEAGRELVARMDRRGKWTAEVGGYKLKSSSPRAGTTSWDAEPLRRDLLKLARDGVIDREAVDEAVELVKPRDTYLKARPGAIAALEKVGGDVAAVVAKHRYTGDPPRRTVTVKRATAQ